MPRRISLLSLPGMLLIASASAHAGTLTQATWFQTTQGFPMTRTFFQLGATGNSSGNTSIAVNLSYPAFVTSFFAPKTANGTIDLHVKITQGGAQAITATPSMAMGTPGIPGNVTVMTAMHLAMGAGSASMFDVGLQTLVKIPLSNGQANQFTNVFTVIGVAHYMTVDFYAWTPHTLSFTGLTSQGKSLPDVVAMGSFNLTANGGGTVTLVAPSKLSIDGALAQRRSAGFTKLVLIFVPEPSTLLLLGGSALALTLASRRGQH